MLTILPATISRTLQIRRALHHEMKIVRQINAAIQSAYLEIWAVKTNYAPLKSNPALAFDLHEVASYYVAAHWFSVVPVPTDGQMHRYRETGEIAEKRNRLILQRRHLQATASNAAVFAILRRYSALALCIQLDSNLLSDSEIAFLKNAQEKLREQGHHATDRNKAVKEIRTADNRVTAELLSKNRWRIGISGTSLLAIAGLASASLVALGYLRAHTILAYTGTSGSEYLGIDDYIVSGVSTIPWQLLSVFATWFSLYQEVSKNHIFFGILSVESKSELISNIAFGLVSIIIFIWIYISQNHFAFFVLYYLIFFLVSKISYEISGRFFKDRLPTYVALTFIIFSATQTALSGITYGHHKLHFEDLYDERLSTVDGTEYSNEEWIRILVASRFVILKNKATEMTRVINLSQVKFSDRGNR